MTTKEWFMRGKNLKAEIKALEDEQAKAKAAATGIVPMTTGERVQTSHRNTIEDKFINYASYSEKLEQRRLELLKVKWEINDVVGKIEDTTMRALLTMRYINFYTWEKIAVELNYNYTHLVHRLHPKALKAASQYINMQ